MYKLISYYRAYPSQYPGIARIIQVTPSGECALYIENEVIGTVYYRKGRLPDLENQLFSFIPTGHTRPFFWKKVTTNGN